jgi:hypothetical protein
MAKTPRMLMVVHTDVDPAHEVEFNTWYDEDHLKAIVDQPGFVRGRRYVCVEGGDQNPKYLAVYEFERAEDRKTPEYAEARGFKAMTPHVRNTTIGVFRKISEYEKPNRRVRRRPETPESRADRSRGASSTGRGSAGRRRPASRPRSRGRRSRPTA